VSAALRPSSELQALPEARAKALPRTLRGGEVPKTLRLKSKIRAEAREHGGEVIGEAQAATGISDGLLAAAFDLGADREGKEIETGKMPVTFGEFVRLAPPPILLRVLAKLLTERIEKDADLFFPVDDLRLAATVLDTLKSLLK